MIIFIYTQTHTQGFHGGSDGKESACNAGDPAGDRKNKRKAVPGKGRKRNL